jgi:hypothetical protein
MEEWKYSSMHSYPIIDVDEGKLQTGQFTPGERALTTH